MTRQFKSRFLKNILHMVSGTVISQFVVVLAMPLLSRIYSPEDFGKLALFVSFFGLLLVIANLRYHLAIPIEMDNSRAIGLVAIGLITSSAIFTILLLIALIFVNVFLVDNEYQQYYSLMIIAPFGFLLVSIYQLLNYWEIRKKNLKLVSRTRVTQSLVMVAVQLVLYKAGAIALVVGHVLGQCAGVMMLANSFWKSNSDVFRSISETDLIALAIRYKRFPLVSTWSGLLNAGGRLLPSAILAYFYDVQSAGLFFFAQRLIAIPLGMSGGAVFQSFYAEAADKSEKAALNAKFCRVSAMLLLLISIPSIFLFNLGEEITSMVFGEKWSVSGRLIESMVPLMITQFVVSPLSGLMSITENQVLALKMQLVLSVFQVGAIVISGVLYFDLEKCVLVYSIASATGYAIYYFYLNKVVRLEQSVWA